MAALKNANKRRPAGPYNLPACHIGEDKCETVDMVSIDENPQTGDKGRREYQKLISPSLRFQPGETLFNLDDAVLKCPEIQGAISRGELIKVG